MAAIVLTARAASSNHLRSVLLFRIFRYVDAEKLEMAASASIASLYPAFGKQAASANAGSVAVKVSYF